MALLLSVASSATSPLYSSGPSFACIALPPLPSCPGAYARQFTRLQQKNCFLKKAFVSNVRFPTSISLSGVRRVAVSTSVEDAGSIDLPPEGSPSSLENLPLESKLQERLEQKLKMKLAKKIRLRRKRLVRKRRMRKKGRWPPSKMKKNKNV